MKKIFGLAILLLALASCKEKPVENRNSEASLPESFGFDQMQLKVISSSINPAAGTMGTLYGNEVAVKAMRSEQTDSTHAKKTLVLVTWKQQDDPKWFGAKIPAGLMLAETLTTSGPFSDTKNISYKKYTGKNLQPVTSSPDDEKRILEILQIKPSILP